MGIGRRLAKLEQQQTGDAGAGVIGVRRVDHATGDEPDVVTVAGSGETMSAAAFHARYPRGLLILLQEYGDAPTGGAPV